MTVGERRYAGRTADERRGERRRRLLDAGLELFGTRGYAATRIEDVCSVAGVTARKFYEAFPSREALLVAVYDEVVAEHVDALAAVVEADDPGDAAGRVRLALEAAVAPWAADRRRARIAFVEIVGVSPAVEEHRLAAIRRYALVIAAALERLAAAGLVAHPPGPWTAHALLGAVIHVLEVWADAEDAPPVEAVVDDLARLFLDGLGARR